MKILALAQTPPPTHGQSLMVRELINGLPALGIEVEHVQMRLSSSHKDIGSLRPGKVLTALRAAAAARSRLRHGKFDALYYVPAPAKRGAIFRDIAAMALCRRPGTKLVLHWHAFGLGEWFMKRADTLERRLAFQALGRADLSIVLSPDLVADAQVFAPVRTIVVANGIPDPGPPPQRTDASPYNIVFIGLGTREKGLFDLLSAVSALNGRNGPRYRITAAGGFGSAADERDFKREAVKLGGAVRHVGFAGDALKRELLSEADVFCLPTQYPHEGQPLTLIEAMAYDLRIVATQWRGIPEMLPNENSWYTKPGKPGALAEAIEQACNSPRPRGATRRHFENRFTIGRHLDNLAAAFRSLEAQ